jgi:hypothetical protein
MTYIKNFIFTAIFVSTLFAGQALESAKVYIKDKDWDKAEGKLIEALDHPKDRWEAAFHLGDKIYPRKQDWVSGKKIYGYCFNCPKKFKN